MNRNQITWQKIREAHADAGRPLKGETLLLLLQAERVPVDVMGIIESLKIDLSPLGKSDELSGEAEVSADTARIRVNTYEPARRQRFTMAHELCHVLFHPAGTMYRDNKAFAGDPNDPVRTLQERQANEFASELLMPASAIRNNISVYGVNASLLAAVFHVSLHAMTVRLSRLGYL